MTQAQLDIYNKEGKITDSLELVLPVGKNLDEYKNLIAQLVRSYLTNKRASTVSTKSRSQVAGSTRKIYRQKGTGRARHGSIKAPIFVGGGVTFALQGRNNTSKINKKMKQKAFSVTVADKIINHKLVVINEFNNLTGKTKEFADILHKLREFNLINKSLLLVTDKNKKLNQASRNINNIKQSHISTINTYDVLTQDAIIVEKEVALKLFEKAAIKVSQKKSPAKKEKATTIRKTNTKLKKT